MTFHDLMVLEVCLALVWLAVERWFWEWSIYACMVSGFFAWATGNKQWVEVIYGFQEVAFVVFLAWVLYVYLRYGCHRCGLGGCHCVR